MAEETDRGFWLTQNNAIKYTEQPEHDEDHQDQPEDTSQSGRPVATVGIIAAPAAEDEDQDDHN
ncbi:hypothetical protein BEN30_15005 [Magnetovibrio blakemorei]|uniref:Uncharacterized protein n=1 Tax=Magnetovibrio blakemorei TaxID=28181 RepID=A0A1E5Q4X8_9PROT|nr:hypothetical protein BEN30_15005 [Magnetovibrio blakemorei]